MPVVEKVMSTPYFVGSRVTPLSSVPRRLMLLAGEVLEEILAGFGAAAGLADDLDDVVEVVERDLVAEEDVLAVAGLAEEEGGAAADDFDAVIEEGADGLVEREFLGLAVVDGQEDHGEGLLHLGVLVELVEDDLVLGAALEADDDAHAVAVGLVAELVAGDVGDDALVDELGDALDELGLVDLVGDLGDDDGLAAAGDVFDGALGAHHEAAAAGACRRWRMLLLPKMKPPVGKSGPLTCSRTRSRSERVSALSLEMSAMQALTTSVRLCGGMLVAMPTAMPPLPLTMRLGMRAGRTVGSSGGLVVVGGEVDGVGVDVGEHLAGDAGEAGLGVTHGGGWVAVDGAEVALAVYEGVAEGEGLGEADHGVVDGGVAVGMVVAHDVADDLGGLGVLLVELEAHLLHAVEDAAVDGLEAVADVGQGAADDDRHGVVEVRPAHLLFNIDGEHEGGAAALDGVGGRSAGIFWVVRRRKGEFGVLIVCHGFIALL